MGTSNYGDLQHLGVLLEKVCAPGTSLVSRESSVWCAVVLHELLVGRWARQMVAWAGTDGTSVGLELLVHALPPCGPPVDNQYNDVLLHHVPRSVLPCAADSTTQAPCVRYVAL